MTLEQNPGEHNKTEGQVEPSSYREELEKIGKRILEETRTEILLDMRFLAPAMGSLSLVMDVSTFSVGTDASSIRFNPRFLMVKYIEHPFWLKRAVLHMLMHCLFRHMFDQRKWEDEDLWNLCCDIAVESVIDSMQYASISRPLSEKRSRWYDELHRETGVLTAQRLYHTLSTKKREYPKEDAMQEEFGMDDHAFWMKLDREEDKNQNENNPVAEAEGLPLVATKKLTKKEWEKLANRVRVNVPTGREAGSRTGELVRFLSANEAGGTDYRAFLQKFMITREETHIDVDSFDYGYYNYGMTLYKNMPLIEENEFRETRKVEELILVLDTSASCEEVLVQRFLNETAAMLLRDDLFYEKVSIHIIECDEQVQNDLEITSRRQMEEYARHFCLKGGCGTDFRPAFAYVEQLRKEKKIRTPKGLMYFTDGKGIYPKKPTDYETAFVFVKEEDPDTSGVPNWAEKLFIS